MQKRNLGRSNLEVSGEARWGSLRSGGKVPKGPTRS